MKIRLKITLLFTLLVTAILLILNIFIYYSTADERKSLFRTRLKSRASNNAQVYDYFGDSSVQMLQRIDAGTLVVLPRKSVMIYDTSGKVLYDYRADPSVKPFADRSIVTDAMQSGEKFFVDEERDGFALFYKGGKRFVIVVEAFDEDGWLRLSELRKSLILSLVVGMLVTIITGMVFSSQLVRPMNVIINRVNDISSHDLSKRVPEGNSKDELNKLARTFNLLLERLEESFATQRRFISNASHELSTPLTSISSQLQVTLQKDRNAEEYKHVLASIQEDVQHMRQLTKSLLEIAKTGTQGGIELTDVRMDELILKLIADVMHNNSTYQVDLEFPDLPAEERECMVFGNYDLLYSALINIIENGCKYAPDKRSLVRVFFSDTTISIHVINKGDIINKDLAEQIFQPFFRGPNARGNEGFGLGLPLAKRIIGLHKGSIEVKSGIDGTEFIIKVPSIGSHDF